MPSNVRITVVILPFFLQLVNFPPHVQMQRSLNMCYISAQRQFSLLFFSGANKCVEQYILIGAAIKHFSYCRKGH